MAFGPPSAGVAPGWPQQPDPTNNTINMTTTKSDMKVYLELSDGSRVPLETAVEGSSFVVYRVDPAAGQTLVLADAVEPSKRPSRWSLDADYRPGTSGGFDMRGFANHRTSQQSSTMASRTSTPLSDFNVYRDNPGFTPYNTASGSTGYPNTTPNQSGNRGRANTNTTTASGTLPDKTKKEYCTHWIRRGECDFIQQGCLYKHQMPSLEILRTIGFSAIPQWWIDRQAAIERRNNNQENQFAGWALGLRPGQRLLGPNVNLLGLPDEKAQNSALPGLMATQLQHNNHGNQP